MAGRVRLCLNGQARRRRYGTAGVECLYGRMAVRPGVFLVLSVLMAAACAPVPVTTTLAQAVPSTTFVVTPAPIPTEAITIPPPGAQRMEGGCGGTTIYKGGTLPSWALVNAPTYLTYVVAMPP